jgi:hypothetical protein
MVLMFTAGATGVLLGLWFRAGALIAASATTVVLGLLLAPLAESSLLSTAGLVLILLSLLQAGYLAGLMISHVWSRGGLARSGCDHLQTLARALNSGARAR